jgi:hypothetical protein
LGDDAGDAKIRNSSSRVQLEGQILKDGLDSLLEDELAELLQ